MPEGMKGFQPGRQKTGGRQKGGPVRKASKFIDQLDNAGFNYVKELAAALKDIKSLRATHEDPKKAAEEIRKGLELKMYYSELKSLLPYMAPKLREKEVDTVDRPDDPPPGEAFSTEDLMRALDGKETKDNSRPSNSNPMGAGRPKLQIPSSTKEDPSSLAGEQEED